MSPTIVYGPDGKVRLAVGAAGGATIIAQVAKAIIGVIDWNLSAQEAIALPHDLRARRPVCVEQGTALEAMVPALQALGHRSTTPAAAQGQCDRMVGGRWVGAADPRSEGRGVRAVREIGAGQDEAGRRGDAAARTFPQSRHHVLRPRREKGDAPFLWAKQEGAWRSISWREAAEQVARARRGAEGIGLNQATG